ncbi:MAG TPA: hypothetical protein VJV79_19790 [Polyangiaceae bacterium]|nr:hypothetical protein [Polyangiaceae bacterium]
MCQARCNWLLSGGLSLALLLGSGCAEQPGATRIVGPDGTQMLHVHCSGEQVACFQIAGERCPRGYDLSPVFDPREGNFLVRCRVPKAPPVVVASSPAPRPNGNPAAAVSDRWPPAEVATPTEPWPTQASSELPPAPRNANGTVDLGY